MSFDDSFLNDSSLLSYYGYEVGYLSNLTVDQRRQRLYAAWVEKKFNSPNRAGWNVEVWGAPKSVERLYKFGRHISAMIGLRYKQKNRTHYTRAIRDWVDDLWFLEALYNAQAPAQRNWPPLPIEILDFIDKNYRINFYVSNAYTKKHDAKNIDLPPPVNVAKVLESESKEELINILNGLIAALDNDTEKKSTYSSKSRVGNTLQALNIPSDTWFSLAVWGKETGNLDGWQRNFTFNIGKRIANGLSPSPKQAIIAINILDEAKKLGFGELGIMSDEIPF